MEQRGESNLINKQRFETLIDAIFAIVMTFLVLEFKVPHIENATSGQLKESIVDMLPLLFCYIVSFFTIAVIWIDHHFLFKYVTHVTKNYAYLNFLFLATVSALPFATGFAGEYIYSPFAVALFNSSILLMNIFFTIVFMYPQRKNLIDPAGLVHLNKKSLIPMIGMLLIVISVPMAYVNTILAFGLSFIVLILHIFKKY